MNRLARISVTAATLCTLAANHPLMAGERGHHLTAAHSIPDPAPPCDSIPQYHLLDFWVGKWDVFVGPTPVGKNRIERILNGCAVMEHWQSASGGEGQSLFYYDPAADRWTQVWITDRGTAPGGLKEKRLIGRLDNGGLRFGGTVTPMGGKPYLDRTTLQPLKDGEVQQTIEISTDGGATWKVTFDAVYRKPQGDG